MARAISQCGLVVVLTVLLACASCQEPATVSLYGEGAQLVWKDAGGGQVASLKRNGSAVVLDSPLTAQDVHTNSGVHAEAVRAQEVFVGNASLSTTFEMIMNLTDRVGSLMETNANMSAEVAALRAALAEAERTGEENALSSTWDLNDNWFDLATTVDNSLKGFTGGFAIGDFAYYVPYESTGGHHGRVVRISMSDFSSSGVEWFDLETSVDPGLVGFISGFAAGNFAYYVPYLDGSQHGRVVRINASDFSSSGVEWFDLETTVDGSLVGFTGGFATGDFAYYVPFSDGSPHGRVVRINMSTFSSSGVQWFDLTTVDTGLKGYRGGFASGDYAYYVPFYDGLGYHSRVVRVNTSNFSSSGVQSFDVALTVHPSLKGFLGGFAAGDFAYYVPYYDGSHHGRVMRIRTSEFTSSSVEWFDMAATVDAGLRGFRNGFAAGGFAYYVPYNDGSIYRGRVVRINTADFTSSGVQWFDLETSVAADLKGFYGGFAVGDFAYYVPFFVGSHHGRVVRVKI